MNERATLHGNPFKIIKLLTILFLEIHWQFYFAVTEDEDGTIVYTIVLDNKTEVKVDVVKWTIVKTGKRWAEHYDKSRNEGTKEIEDGDNDVGSEK
jgi:hypothetical protein